MKVNKDPLCISNKKKNAPPSSKLLKPKKLKSNLMKSSNVNKLPLSVGKLKLVKENINGQLDNIDFAIQDKPAKKVKKLDHAVSKLQEEQHVCLPKIHKKSKKSVVEQSEVQHIPTLFDFVTSHGKDEGKLKDKVKIRTPKIRLEKQLIQNATVNVFKEENKVPVAGSKKSLNGRPRPSRSMTPLSQEKIKIEKDKKKEVSAGELIKRQRKAVVDKSKTKSIDKCGLSTSKVANVTKGLLKLIEETPSIKQEFLDIGEPIFLQVECIKIPICATKQLRFKLPHSLIDETSSVLLVTADLKGHKIHPDKAVDHYEELLSENQVDFITKVMPIRMVKQEYSQYEMKRKLVDQYDIILADNRIHKSLGVVLGKFALYKRKMPIPVNLTLKKVKLQKHLKDAVNKTQMTIKSNGHASVIQVGHSKMSAMEVAENIVEVTKSLEKVYPGGWINIRSLAIKTAKSTSLPVYFSMLSPNEVRIPVEVNVKPPPIEDELSTMPGHNVMVTSDWNVVLKKVEEDLKIDDSKDDEILEEAKKYIESSKTVRYNDSSDEEKADSESDDEGDAITEAMEKKLMNKYEKNAKTKKNKKEEEEDDEVEEDEEEEESEEETQVVPLAGKKRKSQGAKKQSGPPAKKGSNPVQAKGKHQGNKSNVDKKAASPGVKKAASPGVKKPQTRGTRGGKKTKMSKDQRKALIKRKKAGKK